MFAIGECKNFSPKCGSTYTQSMCLTKRDFMEKTCPQMCNLCREKLIHNYERKESTKRLAILPDLKKGLACSRPAFINLGRYSKSGDGKK